MSAPTARDMTDLAFRNACDRHGFHPVGFLGYYELAAGGWYCSVRDAGRTALVLGPFATEAACRRWAYYDESSEYGGAPGLHKRLLDAADARDPRSWFYSWGMVKMPNGYRDGVLNAALPEADRDMHYVPEPTPGERLAAAIDALPLGEPDSEDDNRDALRALGIGAAVALDCVKSTQEVPS